MKAFAFLLFLLLSLRSEANSLCTKHASDDCILADFTAATSEKPQDVFDHVSRITKQCFYDQTFRGMNWNEEVARSRIQLSDSSSELEVESVVNALLSKLEASHTKFLTFRDASYWALRSIVSGIVEGVPLFQVGAIFDQVAGRWHVRSVFERSPAWHAGLKRGDEILSADRRPFEPIPSFPSSKHVLLEVRSRLNARVKHVRIQPISESFQQGMLRGTKHSLALFKKGRKTVGYFHLWSGTHDAFRKSLWQASEYLEQKSDAWVLDIRDGFGGANANYLKPFFAPSGFTKPVYLLINEGTRSGKETLAHLMKAGGRATLVGKTTAGYYLGGRLFEIVPNKASLYLAVCGDSPAGVPIEGKGISPDIAVDSPLPYSHGEDPQLKRALELAFQNL